MLLLESKRSRGNSERMILCRNPTRAHWFCHRCFQTWTSFSKVDTNIKWVLKRICEAAPIHWARMISMLLKATLKSSCRLGSRTTRASLLIFQTIWALISLMNWKIIPSQVWSKDWHVSKWTKKRWWGKTSQSSYKYRRMMKRCHRQLENDWEKLTTLNLKS